jgi:hypothetical protein
MSKSAQGTDEAAALATPEGATAFFEMLFEYIVSQCRSSADGSLRSRKRFRDALISEAQRFEHGDGWRSGNPNLAKIMACRLREEASRLIELPRGRPRGKANNPAVPLLDLVISGLGAELRKRGSDKADQLLEPGGCGAPGTRGVPSGLSTAGAVLAVLAERCDLSISSDDIRRAVASRRRIERRKRERK